MILSLFNNSRYLLEKDSIIFLKARENVFWQVNGWIITRGKETYFSPSSPGGYKIKASNRPKSESVIIEVVASE